MRDRFGAARPGNSHILREETASGVAAERESEVLSAARVLSTAFRSFGKLMQGTRRHNVIYLENFDAQLTEWLQWSERPPLLLTIRINCRQLSRLYVDCAMRQDKKVMDQRIHFVLPRQIGQVAIVPVKDSAIQRFLGDATRRRGGSSPA